MKATTKTVRANLNLETLEDRLVLSLTSATLWGGMIYLNGNNNASNVSLSKSGSSIVVRDSTNSFSKSFASAAVQRAQFVGGWSNDRVINYVSTLPLQAWGYGGNDYLEGYNAVDTLVGGDGADTLVGYGGGDKMWGGNGDDVLRGMDGNDQLVGDVGNDRINGGAGADKMWGGTGDDVIIAIDNSIGDFVQGDTGRDILWTDQSGGYRDGVAGLTSSDKLQSVSFFSNGADRTLNGDRIADPTVKAGHTYKRFSGNPLFSSSGPSINDVRQGSLGDCWLVAGLGAIANDNAFALRQNVVDFDDGTYGVRLGSRFYRVDNDLPVASMSSSDSAYAKLGSQSSMWVAVVEKAYAHYRSGANSYASIEGGWSVEVNRAFNSPSAGAKWLNTYSSAAALGNDIYARWNSYQAVTVGFLTVQAGCPCIASHQYTVYSVTRNSAGVVTSITLRNPWGVDGAGSDSNTQDGLVTVTPAQIFGGSGQVNWGRV